MSSFVRSLLLAVLVLAAAVSATAQEFLGLYMQGQLIGYVSSQTADAKLGGVPTKQTRTKTLMNTALLGTAMTVNIDIVTWYARDGRPLLTKADMLSGGRSHKVEANFREKDVFLVIDNNGAKSNKVVPRPTGAPIVDDALAALLESGATAGMSRKFFVFDPMSASFVSNVAHHKGAHKLEVDGKTVDAQLVEIIDPRMTMQVYFSGKGDLIKAVALGVMEMRPISRAEAEAVENRAGGEGPDLAEATRIRVSPPLGNPAGYRSVTYYFSGGSFERAPKDPSQHWSREEGGWKVIVAPIVPDPGKSATIAKAGALQPSWTKPGMNIPSANPEMRKLGASIVGKEKNAVRAALKIGRHVHSIMKPNAGIGVLRDAAEILRTKEGVCRDYATLTATLMRAAGIPARMASGLVYDSGAFYYHAWVEIFDGSRWVGIDATRPNLDVTPGHVKLGQGSVEDAFMFTFLERTEVKVLKKVAKTG